MGHEDIDARGFCRTAGTVHSSRTRTVGPIHPKHPGADGPSVGSGVQRRWFLRLPPGYLVLDSDSIIAEQIISALIESGRLPDTHWQVKTRRGKHRWYRIDYPQGKRQLIGGLDIIANWRGNQGVVAPDGDERKTLPGFGEGEPPHLPLPELVNLIEEFQKGTGQIPRTRRDPGWTGEGRSIGMAGAGRHLWESPRWFRPSR